MAKRTSSDMSDLSKEELIDMLKQTSSRRFYGGNYFSTHGALFPTGAVSSFPYVGGSPFLQGPPLPLNSTIGQHGVHLFNANPSPYLASAVPLPYTAPSLFHGHPGHPSSDSLHTPIITPLQKDSDLEFPLNIQDFAFEMAQRDYPPHAAELTLIPDANLEEAFEAFVENEPSVSLCTPIIFDHQESPTKTKTKGNRFRIKSINAHRIVGSRTEYQIQWHMKDCNEGEPATEWRPLSYFFHQGISDLIDEYLSKNLKQ